MAQSLVRALWLFVLPALLAGVSLVYLVPYGGTGLPGWVARIAHTYPVLALAALFLAFSALAHYWRFHLPGGRYASALPADWVTGERNPARLRDWAALAESHAFLSSPRVQRHLAKVLDPGALDVFAGHLKEFWSAIETGDVERARAASRAAENLGAGERAAHAKRQLVGAGLTLGLTVAVIWVMRARAAEPYEILSDSMLPTLERGDRIAANKLAYARTGGLPTRGDILVFRSASVALGPGAWPDVLVKRVVGLPGDRVEMHGAAPVINGWTVPSCDAGRYLYAHPDGDVLLGRLRVEFLGDHAYLTVQAPQMPPMEHAYRVGPGEVFVLGDNRSNSLDSRSWNAGRGGGVPLSAVDGRGQWFLVGAHRGGDADFSRFLGRVDGMQARLRIEGIDAGAAGEGIARCLRDRPKDTLPPPPGAPDNTSGT